LTAAAGGGGGWAPLAEPQKEEKKESQRFWELVGSHQQPQLCLDGEEAQSPGPVVALDYKQAS